jgi:hypothetical protein
MEAEGAKGKKKLVIGSLSFLDNLEMVKDIKRIQQPHFVAALVYIGVLPDERSHTDKKKFIADLLYSVFTRPLPADCLGNIIK